MNRPTRLCNCCIRATEYLPGHAVDIEPVSRLISKVREYLNSRAGDSRPAAALEVRICSSRPLPNVAFASGRQQPRYLKRPDLLVGAAVHSACGYDVGLVSSNADTVWAY